LKYFSNILNLLVAVKYLRLAKKSYVISENYNLKVMYLFIRLSYILQAVENEKNL